MNSASTSLGLSSYSNESYSFDESNDRQGYSGESKVKLGSPSRDSKVGDDGFQLDVISAGMNDKDYVFGSLESELEIEKSFYMEDALTTFTAYNNIYLHPEKPQSFTSSSDDSDTSTSSSSSSSSSASSNGRDGNKRNSILNSLSTSVEGNIELESFGASSTVEPMLIDTHDHLWTRIRDIKINGSVFEYVGAGASIHDNGFAQYSMPLSPVNHYFEVKIINPGRHSYIAVGLARKDYPIQRHPGWNRGSIAFHADDGKIFVGTGVGTPFGPRCVANDVLGCGIIFPLDYLDPPQAYLEKVKWPWENSDREDAAQERFNFKNRHRGRRRRFRIFDAENIEPSSESDDEIWWNNFSQVCRDKVKVYFLRNSKLLGIKEVRIPKGGFYPTIGMLSANEKVFVDLYPLTG